jgi:aryl-alcohol dehydrogenase-like predicted oxidoreductase
VGVVPHGSVIIASCRRGLQNSRVSIFGYLSGEFYGQGLTTANLELVARFFERYPEYADRAFLSVKGGAVPGKLATDGSRENLRRSVDDILKALRGTKRLDLFEPARRDSNYEIEHYAEVLNEMAKEGKFDYIGLSEVNADTVRRAHKVRIFPSRRTNANTVGLGYACRGGRDRSERSSI